MQIASIADITFLLRLYRFIFVHMNYILFDENREFLFPLTHTRPISEIRIGS